MKQNSKLFALCDMPQLIQVLNGFKRIARDHRSKSYESGTQLRYKKAMQLSITRHTGIAATC